MNAIVPYRRGAVRRGASTVAQFASNGVVADVAVERVDRRNSTIWYTLKLASRETDVTGRLVGHRRGATDELGSVVVSAGSMSSARFAVASPRGRAYQAMYLEIHSDEMLLRVEAPRPPARDRLRAVKGGASLLAIAVAGSCIAIVPLALPRTVTLAAPAQAVAGARVHLPYATSGLGATSYAATADDGTVLGAGRLDAASGEIAFIVPPRLASHHVEVSVRAQGLWAGTSRSASFAVTAPHRAAVATSLPRVMSFSARRDEAPGGETVLASYLAVGDHGTISLLDPAGKIVRSAPFTRVGTTRIGVPKEYRSVALTAQIAVHGAGTRALASVAVPPNPVADENDPADLETPGEAITPIDSSASAQAGGIVVVDGRAVGGRPLILRVAAQRAPMQLELEDESGTVIAETKVPAGATRAALPLPPATERTTYLVAVHYEHNGGEETVIRTVVAAPRSNATATTP